MSQHIELAIQDIQEKLRQQEEEVIQTKRTINQLCRIIGREEMYQDAELTTSVATSGALRSDQFYGQPLASAVRSILEMRKASNKGAAPVTDIFNALKQGGYHFETKDDENAKRTLRISLTKNPIFHRVPNGEYGLAVWYPAAKKQKKSVDGETEPEEAEGDAEAGLAGRDSNAPASPVGNAPKEEKM